MHLKLTLISTFIGCSTFSLAQLGSWNILNVKAPIDSLWSVLAEGQIRSLSFYNEFHYYEYKGALSYAIASDRTLTAGIGSYRTFLEGGNFRTPAAVKEIRSWAELSLSDPGRVILLNHRYRVEQRYTSIGYRNRFRYRFGGVLPIAKKKDLFISGWGELFFTNRAPYFERIRSYLGFGYKINAITLQVGYLNQFDYQINDETGRNFFQISFQYRLPDKSTKRFNIPFQEG